MRIKNYIRSFKKFNILCQTEDEWVNIQKMLFTKGFFWETDGKVVWVNGWTYPKILKNYRTRDRFGSQILIMDDYRYMKKKNLKFVDAKKLLRKEKLKQLKK